MAVTLHLQRGWRARLGAAWCFLWGHEPDIFWRTWTVRGAEFDVCDRCLTIRRKRMLAERE